MNETIHFSSFSDYLAAACAKSEMADAERSSRQTGSYREQFTGTRSFDHAVEIARGGWAEGTEKVKAMSSSIRDRILGSLTERQISTWDVTGADVDVGRFVTGEPECMIDFVPETVNAPAKFLRLTVNLLASAGVDAEQIIRRGAAVVALIDALESSGYRAEVDGVFCNGDHTAVVRLKETGEAVEIDRLAFAIAHPSMLRRVEFSYLETLSAQWRNHLGVKLGRGYGHCGAVPFEIRGDINIEAMVFGTDSASADWVLAQLRAQGISTSNNTAAATA